VLERYLESKILKPAIEKLGGMCRKLHTPGFTGIPDRLILLPGGRIYFCETKGVERSPRPRQLIVHAQLRKLGFEVWVIYNREDVNKFIEHIERETY
jgi:hypothetical protein